MVERWCRRERSDFVGNPGGGRLRRLAVLVIQKGFEAGYVAKKEYNHKALDATRREYYQHGFLEGQYALRPQLEKFDVLVEMVTVDTEHLERCLKATKEKMNQEQNKK